MLWLSVRVHGYRTNEQMNMDLSHQLKSPSHRERNHTALPLHPRTLTLGPSMDVFSLPIYLDMEQAQKGPLSNHNEHFGCHADSVTLTARGSLMKEARQHNCFLTGLKQTAGQRTERDKAESLADSHHSMISCSQKGLLSLTVVDEQCRRALSAPRWKSRRGGYLCLALSFSVQQFQADVPGTEEKVWSRGWGNRNVDLSPENV